MCTAQKPLEKNTPDINEDNNNKIINIFHCDEQMMH